MSRPLALFVVAALALCFAPRPVTLELPPFEEIALAAEPKLGDCDWEFELWDPERFLCGLPEPERLDNYLRDQAITADHLGPPLPPLLMVALTPDGEFVLAPAADRPRVPQPAVAFLSRYPFNWRTGRTSGANAESERAVALGLAWLAKQQQQDGGWRFDVGDRNDDRVAATALALLTFLGVGESHQPVRGRQRHKYLKTVRAGLDFLTQAFPATGPNAGRISDVPLVQALATLALCEAYGMTADPFLKSHAQAAIDYLQTLQSADDGWSVPRQGASDIHTTGWAVQALSAARMMPDLDVDDERIKRAVAFLNKCASGPQKATYGTTDHTDAKPGTTATAAGLLCRSLVGGWEADHPGMLDGAAGLAKNLPSASNRDPLYLYFATWVMQRHGGEYWKTWNEGPQTADGTRKGGVRELLITSQFRTDGPTFGSWEPEGEFGKRYGRLGTTALSVLTLEVYYRYLPLYKRKAG